MSGAGHLLGCRDEWQKSLVMPVTTMHWQENSFPKMTKETRFSLRTERQLKGTFTTWNLINVKTWVKISFRNGSCPGGLLSDVVVLQSHFPSLLKCLAAWEKEKQSHMKLFRGLSFLFSDVTVFGKFPLGLFFFFLSLYFFISLFFYFSHSLFLLQGKKPTKPAKNTKKHPLQTLSEEQKWMEMCSFYFTGKNGVKVKGVGMTLLLYNIKCSSRFQVGRPMPAQHHSNQHY